MPAKTALFARGFLADAVRAVAGESVDGTSPDATDCQLAVLQQPDSDSDAVAAAFKALLPGGSCYSEWSGLVPGTLRRVRALLEGAGFVDVRLFWTVPSSDSARAWFEVDSDAPGYRRVVRNLVAQAGAGSLAGAILPFAVDVAFFLGLFPAMCAVGRKPPSAGISLAGHGIDFPGWLAEGIAESGGLSADDLLLVMRAGGNDVENKVTWLGYAKGAPELRWVAKVPRSPATAAALRREHEMLLLLNAVPNRIEGVVVPRVALWEEFDGLPVLVQTALGGESLNAEARRSQYPALARTLGDTLATFAGQPGATTADEWWSKLVEPWLDRLSDSLELLGGSTIASSVNAALADLGTLPLVWAHNDCTPWNATIEGDRLGLFDWEDGVAEGLPLVDLVYLLANTAFIVDRRADAVRTYQRLLDRSNTWGAVFSDTLDAYADKVGVRREDVILLRIATWLIHSAQDLEIRLAKTGNPSPQILDDSICLAILRAELDAYEAGMTLHARNSPA
jgi:Ser/Thr protein kinase RdoA (MazF antagonist)